MMTKASSYKHSNTKNKTMKKNLLMRRLCNACALTILLLPSAVFAQDNYWLLDGFSRVNTATNAVASSPVGPYSLSNVRTVYDASGNEVFTYAGGAVATQGGQGITSTIADRQQAFPIPGKCKQYYILGVSRNSPHNSPVTLTKIDASSSGLPVQVSTGTLTYLAHSNYGAVAGKLDASGNRYIYCLSTTLNVTSSCYLYRYTIAADGSVGTLYQVDSLLPKCSENTRIKMSPDQNSMGYTDVSGNLVTYNFISRNHTSYGVPAVGMAEANVGSARRWFVSTGNPTLGLGYFTEGNTVFTTISTTNGINSEIAQGKIAQGNISFLYIANGNPATGTGTLRCFPSFFVTTPGFTTIPGAQIVGVNDIYTPTAYSFGNNVEGEDINVSQTPTVSFTLNNMTGTNTAPGIIWVCPGMTSAPLNITVGGMHSNSYSYCYQYGTLTGGVFSGVGFANCFAGHTGVIVPSATYNTSIPTGSSPTHVKVDVSFADVCGNWVTNTQYFEIKPVNLLVDFKLKAPSGASCVSINRETNIANLASGLAPTQPILSGTPFCQNGWLGAGTAGILGATYTASSLGILNYKLVLEDVTPGNPLPVLPTTTVTRIPPNTFNNYAFAVPTAGWFQNNYDDIKNNHYFKVTLSFATAECGTVSNYSYFRIIDGGISGSSDNPEYWRPGSGPQNDNLQLEAVHVFPNPATDKVHLNWRNETAVEIKGQILFTDVLGKIVLQKELDQQEGNNEVIMNIATLAPGIYHYRLRTAGGDFSGKLIKQ
jgi:hypothetical protein